MTLALALLQLAASAAAAFLLTLFVCLIHYDGKAARLRGSGFRIWRI